MGIVLALVYAVVVGVSDFLGAFAGRFSTFRASSAVAYATQGLAVAVLVPWFGGSFTVGVWMWGAAVGLAFAVTGIALYGGIGRGTPTIVAPLSAVVSAVIPLLVSVARDVELSALQWVGVAFAIAAIWVVTRNPAEAKDRVWFSVAAGTAAGVAISVIYLGLEATNDQGILVLLPASIVGAALLGASLLVDGNRLPSGRGLMWSAATGATMSLSLVAFIAATTFAGLAIVAVVGSLYPVATVAMAALVWRHRPTPTQWVGLAMAVAALALLAW